MLETLKSFFQPQQHSNLKIVTVRSAVNYDEIPLGFFRVRTASGKESLGYRGSFLSWRVGSVVVDGGKRITAPENREELQLVELSFTKPQGDGVQHIGGCSVIDTDSLE